MQPAHPPVVGEERTCCRCGANFTSYSSERKCPNCKIPRVRKPRSYESKELAPRELQIVKLVAGGKLNKEIGGELHLTENTIKEYVHRIFRKVSVTNRTELASWSIAQRAEASALEIEEQTLP